MEPNPPLDRCAGEELRAAGFVVSARQAGARYVVTCRGMLDWNSCEPFYTAVTGGVGVAGVRVVEIDFAELSVLSAAGLRTLLRIRESAARTGTPVWLRNVSPLLQRVLDLVALDERLAP